MLMGSWPPACWATDGLQQGKVLLALQQCNHIWRHEHLKSAIISTEPKISQEHQTIEQVVKIRVVLEYLESTEAARLFRCWLP